MESLNEKVKLLMTIIVLIIALFPTNYILFTQDIFLSEKIFIGVWTSFILGVFTYNNIEMLERLKKIKKDLKEDE